MANGSLPPTLGLAGGVGSGKSTVARVLGELGCVVCDADELGRRALGVPEIRDTLVGWWGRGILDGAGEIDRSAVAAIVFSRPAQRRRLESLVHPWIEARRREQFENAPAGTRALVIDAPLLFEAGLDAECDAVIFVESPRATRLARIRETRGWDEPELSKREESQLPLDDKRSRSDYVIRNDGDLSDLTEQVRRTLSEILQGLRDEREGGSPS